MPTPQGGLLPGVVTSFSHHCFGALSNTVQRFLNVQVLCENLGQSCAEIRVDLAPYWDDRTPVRISMFQCMGYHQQVRRACHPFWK